MTLDIQPAGSILRLPRYERERLKPGLSRAILRSLGLASKPKRRLVRVDEITCPFAFAIVAGAAAESALDELARLTPECAPVILGTPETAANMLDLREAAPFEEALVELNRLDPDRWIVERLARLDSIGIKPPRGSWPDHPRKSDELASIRSFTGGRSYVEPEIVVAAVPTADPSLVALHLGFGDWNDCPSPVAHAAIARRWWRQQGAIPVAFAGDIVEYRVAHPITTPEQATAIALEQFAYCPDSVLQGTETMERLAANLIGARFWSFWWD